MTLGHAAMAKISRNPPKTLSSRPKHDGFMSCAVERSPYWLLLLLLLLLVLVNPHTTSTLVILSVANGPLYWLLLLLLRLPLFLLVFAFILILSKVEGEGALYSPLLALLPLLSLCCCFSFISQESASALHFAAALSANGATTSQPKSEALG